MSKEQKNKIGKSNKGQKRTKETREKLRLSHLGQVCWCKGKHHSEETKKKMRISSAKSFNPTRFKKGQTLGEKSYNWKGGRFKSARGYIYIINKEHPYSNKAGYVLEHRLIAEKCLGRYLIKTEVIHHINKITDDNRPENLYLFECSGKHMSYHFLKYSPDLISNLI